MHEEKAEMFVMSQENLRVVFARALEILIVCGDHTPVPENCFNSETIHSQLRHAHRDQMQTDPTYKAAYQTYLDRLHDNSVAGARYDLYHALPFLTKGWDDSQLDETVKKIEESYEELLALYKQPRLYPAPVC